MMMLCVVHDDVWNVLHPTTAVCLSRLSVSPTHPAKIDNEGALVDVEHVLELKRSVWSVPKCMFKANMALLNFTDGKAGHIADDPDLDISQSMGDIVSTSTMHMETDKNDILPDAHDVVHDLEKRAVELKMLHPIVKPKDEERREANAKHEHTLYLCQRDYKQPCPLGFRHIVTQAGDHRCTAPPSYTGPCMGQDLIYREMPEEEKVSWARDCLANWPCVQCKRRYSDPCPEKWEVKPVDTSEYTCQATALYEGPCKDELISFMKFNIGMQKQWSRRCHAWWPCETAHKIGLPPDTDLPITHHATIFRVTQ